MTKKQVKQKTKAFSGSKPSTFYGEGYYLRGEGSNYGRKDENGNLVFAPYDESAYLPRNRQLAAFLTGVYKPKTALVLGCARAYLVQALRELGVDAKGIDISEWAVNNAPTKIREHLYVGDICDLSRFETGQFDVVTAFDVFEHITVPDLYLALDEAARVCKNTLIIDVPTNPDDLHPDQSCGTDKSHVSVYSERFWTRQFEEREMRLEGKDVYTYPEGNGGATLIFRQEYPLQCEHQGRILNPEPEPVNIVMLSWNQLKLTTMSIETLYKNTDYPFRLIVVDNQSTDGSAEWLNFASKAYPNMNVVHLSELNGGFAEGVNTGLRFIRERKLNAPYTLLLNNDTLFAQKDWLSLMVHALEKDAANGIVTPKLLYPDGRIQYGGASFNENLQPYHIGRFKQAECFNAERELPWGTFACALIRSELLVDGLDAAYKLGAFEDVDFCLKARLNGYKVLYAPQSRVYHYEGATVFTVNKQQYQQQQTANAQLFFNRWGQWVKMNRAAHPELYAEGA